jgi:hypothetical protein
VTPFQEENHMQTRYRAAATALLLTATAGLAATGGSAEASGTHHTSSKAARTLTITVKSKAHALKVSDDTFRPGNTMFRVKNIDGKDSNGLVQLLRLRHGYTLADAFNDIPQIFGGDVAAIKRVDKNVVFYGGMNAKGDRSNPQKWAANLNTSGTYYLVNFDTQKLAPLKVRGSQQDRAIPSRDGFINTKTSHNRAHNTFKAGRHNAASGWMSTRNKAHEPHFVDIEQVKKGTTNADITALFNGTASSNPFVRHGAGTDTGVISPGHRFLWAYDLKPAKYAVMCFWPSIMNGKPHAEMGMHIVTSLH